MNRFFSLLVVTLVASGCGKGVAYVPVTGSVKFADGSVPQGEISTITFQPATAGPSTKGASGTIGADGEFTLLSVTPGDGALPGEYRVTVHVMQGYPNGRSLVAAEYTTPDATPLKATVEASGDNRFDFTVEKP